MKFEELKILIINLWKTAMRFVENDAWNEER
jgi:hypothetical protein